MFEKTLVKGDHVRSFHVERSETSAAGWEVSETTEERVVNRQAHQDWHRVERTLERFNGEIAELRRQGWRDS
jgi:hypothetical protein